jgi:hypothetical protein
MESHSTSTWKVNFFSLLALLIFAACGGGSERSEVVDTSPNTFSFSAKVEQDIAATIESGSIRINGINTATPLKIDGGEYSLDGGEYSNIATTVTNQQQITLRLKSSENYATTTSVTITIGNVSETFSVTTHNHLTRFANKLTSNSIARYSVVNQPLRGRVIVSPDLTNLTYQPLSSYDYLQAGEIAEETITVSLIGEEDISHELTFIISGQATTNICDNKSIIEIIPSERNNPMTNIINGNCVRLDASNISGGSTWYAWTGDNGAARTALFSTVGIDAKDATLTFLPPARGKYSLSWCPINGECVASFYFYNEELDTERELDISLAVDHDEAQQVLNLSVMKNNNADTTEFTYRWIIHDWAGKYRKFIDVTTRENQLTLQIPEDNNNYEVSVIVDDNIFQLEGGFYTSSKDNYGTIKFNASTHGNYKTLNNLTVIRDKNSTQRAPVLTVMIDGDPVRYSSDTDEFHIINANMGSQITFDLSETTDENNDTLSFFINGVLHEDASSRFTFDITQSTYFILCANDGFPWTGQENPCVYFDLEAH